MQWLNRAMLRLHTENTLDREEKIMSEWLKTSLIDIVELIGGGTPKTSKAEYWGGNINWLSVKDFNNENRYVYSTEKTITEEGLNNSSTKLLRKDDIIISARGTVGELAMIPFPMAFNQSCYGIRAKEGIDSTFLYYLIKHSVRKLKAMTHGSVFDTITRDTFANIDVAIPDIEMQQRVAKMLANIDDKVENNQRINNNLEQQTQAIFKSWFVDFELNYGIMPSDWKVSQLGSIAKISTEVFSPAKNPNVEVEHYSIPAYDEKRYPVFETSNGIKSNKYRLSSNSVMISKLNPDTKRIWRPYCISDNPICSTEFIVYEPINPLNRDFIYSIIDSIGFSAFLCSHTTGSTNSRQRATPSITLTYDIIVPDEKTIQAFCSIVSPMYDTIENNIKENQKLAETRDKLLPKLMSGELDVSGIDL
ncbi:restriction endonuclease subunit S [Blautia liquoris]|uniref:restriction endonuclease subunit S n=1 Tax=Blautia liquoris TaxID=2779518 RepID=UPI001A9B759E|nr:restriction endonuclease subunit S [Blautia liquoris]